MRHTPQRPNASGWGPPMPDDTTIADDTTRTLYPAQQAKPGRAPRVKPPRWPLPGKGSGRPHGSAYSRSGRARSPIPHRVPAHAPYAAYAAPRDMRVIHAVKRYLPRFHPIHLVLAGGVIAMWGAIMLPWGVDAGNGPIYIQQFSIPRISDPSVDIGQLALQTATSIAGAAVVMAGALLLINIIYALLNKLLRRLGLSALAAILFVPLFGLLIALLLADLTLAAGFGGLGFLSQLPFVRDHGFASIGVAHAGIGFYLWWIGIGATLIGTLGEVFVDRG